MKKLKYKLVRITWVDSSSNHGWGNLAEAMKETLNLSVETVGWLLQDDDDIKRIASHIADYETPAEQPTGLMTIPTCSVTDMKVIG